jgi:hypothetical protein
VSWYGSQEQKERFLRAATSDPTGEFLGGWTASEPPGNPSGTANFDIPLPRPAGVGLTASRDGDAYVLTGRKYWPSSAGWDEQGVNLQTAIVRTDPDKGGTEGLSAIIVERGTPGITYKYIDKEGHRLTSNAEVVFDNARVPAENLLPGAHGNGDFVINRNFAWSGPVAAIAAVGVARAAYEKALTFAKANTAGALKPIIHFQNVGYVLGDVAAKIEMGRYFSWRAADYLDKHDQHAELVGAMNKIQVTEMMFDRRGEQPGGRARIRQTAARGIGVPDLRRREHGHAATARARPAGRPTVQPTRDHGGRVREIRQAPRNDRHDRSLTRRPAWRRTSSGRGRPVSGSPELSGRPRAAAPGPAAENLVRPTGRDCVSRSTRQDALETSGRRIGCRRVHPPGADSSAPVVVRSGRTEGRGPDGWLRCGGRVRVEASESSSCGRG